MADVIHTPKAVIFSRDDAGNDTEGTLTYFQDAKYPFNGYPYERGQDMVNVVKKAIICTVRLLQQKKMWFALPFVYLFRWSILYAYTETINKALGKFYWKEHRYCKSGREVWRACSFLIDEEKNEKKRVSKLHLLKIVLMVWDFDEAYRYRAQDVLSELDKKALSQRPRRELLRLFAVYNSREQDTGISKNFALIKAALFLVCINPFWLKQVKRIFLNLKLEKIKMDTSDKYYGYIRHRYRYKGLSEKKRLRIFNCL